MCASFCVGCNQNAYPHRIQTVSIHIRPRESKASPCNEQSYPFNLITDGATQDISSACLPIKKWFCLLNQSINSCVHSWNPQLLNLPANPHLPQTPIRPQLQPRLTLRLRMLAGWASLFSITWMSCTTSSPTGRGLVTSSATSCAASSSCGKCKYKNKNKASGNWASKKPCILRSWLCPFTPYWLPC